MRVEGHQIHCQTSPNVLEDDPIQGVHVLDHQYYFQEVVVDSNFHLVLSYFHLYPVTPKVAVFVVALSLEVFASLYQEDQIHSNRYYFVIYLYLVQLQALLFLLLVPLMLLGY